MRVRTSHSLTNKVEVAGPVGAGSGHYQPLRGNYSLRLSQVDGTIATITTLVAAIATPAAPTSSPGIGTAPAASSPTLPRALPASSAGPLKVGLGLVLSGSWLSVKGREAVNENIHFYFYCYSSPVLFLDLLMFLILVLIFIHCVRFSVFTKVVCLQSVFEFLVNNSWFYLSC